MENQVATVVTTQAPAPAAPVAAPAPTTPPPPPARQTVREALDAYVKESQTPQPPAATTPPPTDAQPPAEFPVQTPEQVAAAVDEQAPEPPPEADEMFPQDVRDHLRAIQDPKTKAFLRKALVERADFRKLTGFAELKERLRLAPTIELARQTHEMAAAVSQLREAYSAPEGTEQFLGTLYREDPAAFERMTAAVAGQLYQVNRRAYYDVAGRGVKNVIENLRAEAKRTGDEDFGTAADIVEKFTFPGGKSPSLNGDDIPPDHPLMRRLQTLEEERTRARYAASQQFTTSVQRDTEQALRSEIGDIVSRGGASFPEPLRAEVAQRIWQALDNELVANPNVRSLIVNAMRTGGLDDPHRMNVVRVIRDHAQKLLAQIAPAELRRTSEVYGLIRAQTPGQAPASQAQPQQQAPRIDIGSLASVNTGQPPPQVRRGMTQRQVLDALVPPVR